MLDKQKEKLEQLVSQESALSKEFSQSVARDFSSQVEGLVGELDRNKAMKVAFARKRLTRNIDATKAKIGLLKKEYCKSCVPDDDASLRNRYCKAELSE